MKIPFLSHLSAIVLGAAVATAPAFLSQQAYGAPINGSGSIVNFSVTPNGGVGDLLSATSFTFGLTEWATGASNLSGLTVGDIITSSTLSIGNLGAFSFTSNNGNFAAVPSMVIGGTTFNSAVVASSGSIASGSESLTIYLIGTFTPGGPLGTFDPNNASETISFTETGIGSGTFGSFSVSATLAAPASAPPASPPTDTPEPASMALVGAGLVGLGATRRRNVQGRIGCRDATRLLTA